MDNAAVELKTLRMASNVPLRRVREAVVDAIVEKIPLVDGDVVEQKKEIWVVVKRWGELINRIGGVDAVETVSVLQVRPFVVSCLNFMGIEWFLFVGAFYDVESYASLWSNTGSSLSS